MIKKIQMRNCATYDEAGIELSDCSKINFIYGPNGSGKSTISNYFQDEADSKYVDCSVDWELNQSLEVLVYNRHFKESNFSGDLDGVFTLGKDVIDDMTEIEELKERRKSLSDSVNKRKKSLQEKKDESNKHTQDFQDTIWNVILKENEADFQEAFTGFRASKRAFFDQVIKRYKEGHSSPHSREELLKKATTLFSEKPQKFDQLELEYKDLLDKLQSVEAADIWAKHIVGNQDVPIAALISHLGNSDWVQNGMKYIGDDCKCPFCQQDTITDALKSQLEQFFNREYETYLHTLSIFQTSYDECSQKITKLLTEILTNDSFFTISKIDAEKIRVLIDAVQANINANKSEIEKKLKEPSRSVTLNCTDIEPILNLISSGNETIQKHNMMVDNFAAEKRNLITEIWTFLLDEQEALISGYLKDCKRYEKAITGISDSIDRFEKEIIEIEKQIIEKNKNISSVQPTVDEINRLLKAYGFNNFKIVPSPTKENSYQIQRHDGSLASNTLSEGEETFISFLYFLQLTKGATDISRVSTEKVLIIDDPICSLDSTILYIVSCLVKTLISDVKKGNSNIRQIFIFTHNVFFHKEASFVDGKIDNSNDVSYWILHKDESVSKIITYHHNNPIHTSYELLWRELKDTNTLSFITIQNTMRRIIENYFGMLGNRKYDHIKKAFQTVEEQQICESLFYWINDGSHSIPDDLYIDSYSDSIEKYKKVFKDVFFISGHIAHYNMMMGVDDQTELKE